MHSARISRKKKKERSAEERDGKRIPGEGRLGFLQGVPARGKCRKKFHFLEKPRETQGERGNGRRFLPPLQRSLAACVFFCRRRERLSPWLSGKAYVRLQASSSFAVLVSILRVGFPACLVGEMLARRDTRRGYAELDD